MAVSGFRPSTSPWKALGFCAGATDVLGLDTKLGLGFQADQSPIEIGGVECLGFREKGPLGDEPR